MMDDFAAQKSPRNNDVGGKVVCGVLLTIVFVLSALTAAIPVPVISSGSDPAALAAINNGDNAWVLTSAALVLIMTPGLSFFYGGMVDHKNVLSTMYQSFVAMGFISILWVWIGFSLSFGDSSQSNGIIGHPATYFMFSGVGAQPHPNPLLAPTIPLMTFAMFQLMFAIITPALISGSLAERVNFNSWMIFLCVWHILVYCPLAHMAFHPDGAFRRWGVLDFAGGTVVEMASGYSALAGAIFLGKRNVRVNSNANIPFVLLGTALFWFGWLGFDAGSAGNAGPLASLAFATTNTGAAAGMVTWIFLDKMMGKLPSIIGACNGCVVGLVALTPSNGWVTVGGGMCIGCIATLICYFVGTIFNELSGIDDSLDVFTVHGLGGTIGFICTGIFCSLGANASGADGLIYGKGLTLGKHLAVCCCIIPLIMIVTYGIMFVCDLIIPMRVTEEQEHLGLDISMHNETVAENTMKNVDSIPRPSFQEHRASQIYAGPGSIETGTSSGPTIDWGTKGPGPQLNPNSSYGSHTTTPGPSIAGSNGNHMTTIGGPTMGPPPTSLPPLNGASTLPGPPMV